jgi:uncharacterized LabA/DUF88 family protein
MIVPRPSPCRVHAFIDGQNLFHAVKRAFGYTYPNFDPLRLAECVCRLAKDRKLVAVHVYTGIPPQSKDAKWNAFWSAKIRAMTAVGVNVTTRPLRYSLGPAILPDGTVVQNALIPREKGIDLRLGLDVLRLARHGEFEVALIFSQDGDLAEVVQEIGALRQEMGKWLVVDCAFPAGAGSGIAGAQRLDFDKALYDGCIDPANYFPSPSAPTLPGIA